MKNKKIKTILTFVLIDVLMFAVCLLSFAYLHHVRVMWSPGDDGGGDIIIGRPTVHGTDTPETHPQSPEDTATPGSDGTHGNDNDTAPTAPPETDAVTEPPEPPHKFEELFAPEGKVEITDSLYRSHDIYMTVDEITETVGDYLVRYYLYDVYVRNIENIYTVAVTSGHSSQAPERVFLSQLIDAAGDPIAAVSGDFWYKNAKIAVRNGETLRAGNKTENDFCVMYTDGVIKTFPGSALHGFELTDDVYQVWHFGPSLLDEDGHAKTDFGSKNDIAGKHPRSSIGYYEPGHYCFIVVEGRRHITYNEKRVYLGGIRFRELAGIYERLGCTVAYNFDGGDSAYGYYNGEVIREDWSRAHESGEEPRKIYDIICVGEIG